MAIEHCLDTVQNRRSSGSQSQKIANRCSKQKGENFYLRTFGREHKEAGNAGDYDTEKKEEDALTAKTLF